MKKIVAFLLVFVLLASFGCAKKDDSQKDDGSKIALTAGEVRDKVVAATVSGELLEEMGVDFDDLDLDTSELILPTTIYADTESFLPVRMIVGGESFAELFKEKLADSMGDAMEDATFNASVEDFVMDFSYDDVQLPALPEEARESVKPAPYDPKQSDGSYIIYDQGVAARIVFAEGWECTAAQPVFVCGFDEGHEHYVTFAVHPAMSRDELVEMFMDLYQCDPEKCTMLSPIGDYEVLMWSDGRYEAQYFAFTPMGDGWLEVYTFTTEAEDLIPILTEVLPMAEECMEPPTADFS